MTASNASTDAPAFPEGWIKENGAWVCLGCRRIEAAEGAKEGDTAGLGKRRREALAEFELRRDPGASNQAIAKRIHCQTRFIEPIRDAMIDSGEIAAG